MSLRCRLIVKFIKIFFTEISLNIVEYILVNCRLKQGLYQLIAINFHLSVYSCIQNISCVVEGVICHHYVCFCRFLLVEDPTFLFLLLFCTFSFVLFILVYLFQAKQTKENQAAKRRARCRGCIVCQSCSKERSSR